ncbi:hypothetical protein WNY37_02155 [Henriciella sp. AS95]|uniref:hypothetical protein n=1 Tax=Henriciella sp. AS95 TaxID=3135782 RepID=UPI00316E849A
MLKICLTVLCAMMLAACSAETGTKAQGQQASDEPPFYTVYRNGTGPLTMEELQINIPVELDAIYTDKTRACFLAKVEALAAEAGDPERLDPADVAFLPTDGTWEQLSRFHRRNLLAQAIVSRAGGLC